MYTYYVYNIGKEIYSGSNPFADVIIKIIATLGNNELLYPITIQKEGNIISAPYLWGTILFIPTSDRLIVKVIPMKGYIMLKATFDKYFEKFKTVDNNESADYIIPKEDA